MKEKHCAAKSVVELQNVLYWAAESLKSQVLASPLLKSPQCAELHKRLDEIATELDRMQMDMALAVPQQNESCKWLGKLRGFLGAILNQKNR